MKNKMIKFTNTAVLRKMKADLFNPEKNISMGMLFLILLMLLFLTNCKRSSSDKEFIEPELIPVSADFKVNGNAFSISSATPAFASAPVYFTSSFNERVTWRITINGTLSGAQKILSGTSDVIDVTNSSWDGNSSNIYFFRKNEMCTAVLSFIGTDSVWTTNAIINTTKLYSGFASNGIRYTIIDDFDATSPAVIPITAVSKDLFDTPVSILKDTIIKVQGQASYRLDGLDLNNNSWCGGITHTNLTEIKSATKSTLTQNANDFYINMYVYGTGETNSAIEIKAYEIDDTAKLNLLPAPGYTYEQLVNDAWIVDLPIDWKGWKLVSIKYSQFVPAKDPSTGGAGNRIREPHKVTAVGISLLSLPNSGAHVSFYVDMVSFTEGGPFVP